MRVWRFGYVAGVVALLGCGGQLSKVTGEAGPGGSPDAATSSSHGSTSPNPSDSTSLHPQTGGSSPSDAGPDSALTCSLSGSEWTCTGYSQPMPACSSVFSPCNGSSRCLFCNPQMTLSGQIFTCTSGHWVGTPRQEVWSCAQ
jgi:hypothetical protein